MHPLTLPCRFRHGINMYIFLADFGLSRVITTRRVFGTKTMLAGTPGFQPPEQLMAEVLDERADVYAYGVLLIELFGEKVVWEGLTPFQIIAKVGLQQNPPDFGHIQASIQSICRGCLQKKERRISMSSVLQQLLNATKHY